jgi:hypothetical protein
MSQSSDNISETSTVSEIPNEIGELYQSMTSLMDNIIIDNALLNNKFTDMKKSISVIKLEMNDMSEAYELNNKKVETQLSLLQKQLLDTRNVLLQNIDISIKKIRAEISSMIIEEVRKNM